MMRSANPTLKASTFEQYRGFEHSTTMTVAGTVNKTFIMLLFLAASASFAWNQTDDWRVAAMAEVTEGAAVSSSSSNVVNPVVLMVGGVVGGGIFALVTIFKKNWSAVTAPLYAVFEGAFLGSLSALVEVEFPGIPFQATCLTFCTLGGLLAAYKSGLIKATENFKLGLFAAMSGLFLIYLVTFIVALCGGGMPYIHDSGPIGIGFSLFVVGIAALNLVLDFDFIEQGSEYGAPKYMEWYAAFGLMVTLVWLYVEFLRLFIKLNSRD